MITHWTNKKLTICYLKFVPADQFCTLCFHIAFLSKDIFIGKPSVRYHQKWLPFEFTRLTTLPASQHCLLMKNYSKRNFCLRVILRRPTPWTIWDKFLTSSIKQKFYKSFVDFCVLYQLWTLFCQFCKSNQNKYIFSSSTKHINQQRIGHYIFGLISLVFIQL